METQFLQRISALPPSTPACRGTLRCQPATSPDVPNTRVQRKKLGAMAETSPWLSLEQGALQADPKTSEAAPQLPSLQDQRSPFRDSRQVPGGLSIQNHGLHFPQDLLPS